MFTQAHKRRPAAGMLVAVSTRVPVEMKEQLDRLSIERNLSINGIIVGLLADALTRVEQQREARL